MLDKPETEVIADKMEFLSLMVGDQWFCLPTEHINEIRQWSPVTYIPGSPRFIVGAINLRGTVLPIADLSQMLGLPSEEPTERHAVIVTDFHGRKAGYLVKAVSHLIKVDPSEIRPPPDLLQSDASLTSAGVLLRDEGMVQIIDLEKIQPVSSTQVDI